MMIFESTYSQDQVSDAALFRFFINDKGDFEDMQKMHILKKHEGRYVFFKKEKKKFFDSRSWK